MKGNVFAKASMTIIEGVDNIKKNKKIKTDARRKKALLDLWNWTIDNNLHQIKNEKEWTLLKGFYGLVNTIILDKLPINLCYEYINICALQMSIAKWKGVKK